MIEATSQSFSAIHSIPGNARTEIWYQYHRSPRPPRFDGITTFSLAGILVMDKRCDMVAIWILLAAWFPAENLIYNN